MLVDSEFRDGNVPAGFGNLRVFEKSLGILPEGVEKVYYRGDTAVYRQELLRYLAEGKNERFGVIEFAIGVDVTAEFKKAVAQVEEKGWHLLEQMVDGRRVRTDQQWAEVCFVPTWVGYHKDGPEYRFLAVREPLHQLELPGMGSPQLPFPTLDMGEVRYKLTGVVTNRTLSGDDVIRWYRGRCGKGEEVHAVMKNDLAGGQLPSGQFGVNAAWWGISMLAYNLNSLMKRLAFARGMGTQATEGAPVWLDADSWSGGDTYARKLIIRLRESHPAYRLLMEVRQRIHRFSHEDSGLALAPGPA